MELVQKLLSTRGGTVALGGVTAVIALFVVLVYLNQYRSSVAAESGPVTVLVAKKLIEKGMPGDVVGARELFEEEEAPRSHVVTGAITDPSTLRGRVAVEDIYPGQQLTVGDFSGTTDAIGAKLSGNQRAIALPLDSARGMIGRAEPGDRVDVFASFLPEAGRDEAILKVIAQNALVLDAPPETAATTGATANQTANVLLRVNRDQAAEMAYTIDNGKLWLILRPRAGSKPTKPAIVMGGTLLADVEPTTVYDKMRKEIRRRLPWSGR